MATLVGAGMLLAECRSVTVQRSVDGILDLIGRTPMLRLRRLEPRQNVALYAKLEGFNPTGSVKDRTALALIQNAERSRHLLPGMTVLEASSGNTGIGLAMVCCVRGYALEIVMCAKASLERIAMLRAYGAKVRLTSKEGGSDEARKVADAMAESAPERYCRVSQHRSPENVRMHADQTATEILEQLPGRIDYLVVGVGTGATISGIAHTLRARHPEICVCAVQPRVALSAQEGLRNMDLTDQPVVFDRGGVTRFITISDAEARDTTRALVRRCGLLCGISSGAALAGALKLVAQGVSGTIVTLFPDRGDKYLSTGLFDCD